MEVHANKLQVFFAENPFSTIHRH